MNPTNNQTENILEKRLLEQRMRLHTLFNQMRYTEVDIELTMREINYIETRLGKANTSFTFPTPNITLIGGD